MYHSKLKYYLILLLLTVLSCENYHIELQSELLLFPVGRSFLDASDIVILLNGTEISPEIMYDSCGGYWLKISESDLPEEGDLTFRFTRVRDELNLFNEENVDEQKWLNSSYYIDSENETLRIKAHELTHDIESNVEKAKKIHQFVISHVSFKIYHDSFLDKASKTYNLEYGTCMNFSRLYVALCRAAGVPARTIWGIVYGHEDDNVYDYHHQWAEIQDEGGYWHPSDFTYTTNFDLNDIRYLDLIYAAEENSVIGERLSEKIILVGINYFNDYPATLTGRLGFQLIKNDQPNSMMVEYTYDF